MSVNPPLRSAQQAKHGQQIKRAYNKGGEALASKEATKKKVVHGGNSVAPDEVSRIKSDKAKLQAKSEGIQKSFEKGFLHDLANHAYKLNAQHGQSKLD